MNTIVREALAKIADETNSFSEAAASISRSSKAIAFSISIMLGALDSDVEEEMLSQSKNFSTKK